MMCVWNDIAALFESSSTDRYTLQMKTSMLLISIICLMAAQSETWLAREACCSAREHAVTLRTVTRALFRVANLLLIYASVIENGALIQIYVWYTLAYIVIGFAAAIFEMLLGVKHNEPCVSEFITEVVFLFVLSQCLPLVDTYRKRLVEMERGK